MNVVVCIHCLFEYYMKSCLYPFVGKVTWVIVDSVSSLSELIIQKLAKLSNAQRFLQTLLCKQRVFTGDITLGRMSKRRWVEFKICQTISCSAPVSRRHRASSPTAAAATAGMFSGSRKKSCF